MHAEATRIDEASALLQQYYGYGAFRKGQGDIIESILDGCDTVGIMPTGGGKSVCYQIPALMQDGLTLVVSPLISLMKDQVDALDRLGIQATYLNSTLSTGEVQMRMEGIRQGIYKLLYVAPERLESPQFRQRLADFEPAFVAIDEAHCLSQWGHDFRPSYRAIAPYLLELATRPVVAAFTATATPEVVADIQKLLGLVRPNVFVTGFDRANLTFSVVQSRNKRDEVLAYVAQHSTQSGVIYAATRKEVDNLYEFLRKKGYSVGRYHAGLSDVERSENQERFLYDDVRVMIATNAFGMGIDKSNIRYVLHHNMPKNLEAYYQEAGRAGRDGDPGECILLYSPQDVQVQKFFIEQTVTHEDRRRVEYEKLQKMTDYCRTTECLRTYILRYFGEQGRDGCNNCGNCNQDFHIQDVTVEAQKIFSCILRTKERFGVKLIASILKGSKNKRVTELRLHQQTTYGLMRELAEKEIVGCIQALITEGYLKMTASQYPVVQLQERAVPVLRGEAQVFIKVTQTRVAATVRTPDEPLFEALRALRREIADSEHVPPYVVFADSTLREMAALQPRDEAHMLRVKGIGQRKFDRYGEAFLTVIRRHAGATETEVEEVQEAEGGEGDTSTPSIQNRRGIGRKPRSEQDASRNTPSNPGPPSHLVTFERFQAGEGIADIARARGMTAVTIEGHVIRAAEEGHEIDWTRIIQMQYEAEILAAIQAIGTDKLRPIKEALPEEVSYLSIRGVICKHGL